MDICIMEINATKLHKAMLWNLSYYTYKFVCIHTSYIWYFLQKLFCDWNEFFKEQAWLPIAKTLNINKNTLNLNFCCWFFMSLLWWEIEPRPIGTHQRMDAKKVENAQGLINYISYSVKNTRPIKFVLTANL